MVGRPISPIAILASNWSVTKATKRKATTGNEPLLKRQRGGKGTDANTNPGPSTLESVIEDKSSSDESTVLSGHTSRADFEAKYLELEKLGQGGFGSVYAGHRRSDDLPVAIKHIPNSDVPRQKVMLNGRTRRIPNEVLLMHKAAGEPVTLGKSAAVSILDWYDLDQEVLLVMERPVPSMDLLRFINNNFGPLAEDVAKIIMKQLVDAAIDMQAKGIFHRDIKAENILIESSSDGLRVHFIDFGCGCIRKKNCIYRQFTGTANLSCIPAFHSSDC
ncbi:serine/threonine-protein kinase pim-2-like [Hippoglossus hippoglossus]|uniref:serine/threonine-protein kinase pim-2-like n=1 Tax=Hippoglossus hippoglossus TaxID=8267 RepID=UPI00148BDB6E|nr:serine/threonine-protein kinase pim-2-like [Hippoglossus hippoglossus]